MNDQKIDGKISRIKGTLLEINGLEKVVRLHDLVQLARDNLLAEVIQIHENRIVCQCFESTLGLRLGDTVTPLHKPLSMTLGPGLLGGIFDGLQRPLDTIFDELNDPFLTRGVQIPALDYTKKWEFLPCRQVGDVLEQGDIIGTVLENPAIKHHIMIPPGTGGRLESISMKGSYTIQDELYTLNQDGIVKPFTMVQRWPVKTPRPVHQRLSIKSPFLTGLRVIDMMFPVALGGTVAVPGGFGTGKTIIQQSIAKWCNADVVVYVGCGERGNEIADVLHDFKNIEDPRTGRPITERLVTIANTSNMPISAREASIFSGITIAEYFRDMGYHVALLADSTSRWAESLREISGLLEEMPAEEGYPAYLPSKLSSFYERAGFMKLQGTNMDGKARNGSLTIIGSVSPPSGEFSEPVTTTTNRFVQAFWALDPNLAYAKHYPAINWFDSYTGYVQDLCPWWEKMDFKWVSIDLDWIQLREAINGILSREHEYKNLAKLIGENNLPENQQLELFTAKMLKDGFLIQNAFDPVDCYTTPQKLLAMVKIMLIFHQEAKRLIEDGYFMEEIKKLESVEQIMRICHEIPNDNTQEISNIKNDLLGEINSMRAIFKR
ncbi:V-type ATP synthase subunit A [Candidatus Bathyarchaeota archaeon]|nr:V-type ATP synthase subunit A [Candidatus Bathyarchaeota archaeon]